MPNNRAKRYRENLTQYWQRRLFTNSCTHIDAFLYEIPDEYSRKYTHVIVYEYRDAGNDPVKRTKAYSVIAHSFVPPLEIVGVDRFLERVNRQAPVRVNGKAELAGPHGKPVALWFKSYHHQYLRQILAREHVRARKAKGSISVRLHYFLTSDLDPAYRFNNYYMQMGKGQGRGLQATK